MTDQNSNFSRRDFLGNTLKLGAGSILLGSTLPGHAADKTASSASGSKSLTALPELPARVLIAHEGTARVAFWERKNHLPLGRTGGSQSAAHLIFKLL